jgi:Right handed beta helix region
MNATISRAFLPILIGLLMITGVTSAWATTYYVDATNGNDGNNGQSTSSPWKTITKVNASTFQPGDNILLNRGGIWREQLNPKSSGVQGSPIFFGAYGTGNKPSIRGSNTYNATANWVLESGNLWYLASVPKDPGIFAHNQITAQRKLKKTSLATQWDYWYDATNLRLYAYSTSNPASLATSLEVAVRQYVVGPQSASFITYDNLDIRHAYFIGWLGWGGKNVTFQYCNFTQSGGDHMLFQNGSNNGLVTNCSFDDWGIGTGQYYAVHTQANGTTSTGPVDVQDSTFTFSSVVDGAVYVQPSSTEHTVMMQDTNSWLRNVQRNTIDGLTHINDDGIVIWDSGSDATSHLVEGNVIKNIGGIAIIIQQLENHGAHPVVTVRYNRLDNVCLANTLDKAAIRLRDFSSASPVSVYYNVVNKTQSGSNTEPGIDLSGANGAKIYNNTIYGVDKGIWVRNTSTGAVGMNNIIISNRSYGIQVDSTSSISADYNCINSNAAGNYSGFTAGTHNISLNPLLANATSGDFHLTASSPCIDKGIYVGLTQDMTSNLVPSGAGTDIGAYEYVNAPLPAPVNLAVQ